MEVGHKSNDVIEINQNTPEQSVSPGKVLVAIKAAGINPVDWKIASVHQKHPFASVAISVLLFLFMYSFW
jgi:NADPH:quinone reductase-like Zn-dependent oxidoreductase